MSKIKSYRVKVRQAAKRKSEKVVLETKFAEELLQEIYEEMEKAKNSAEPVETDTEDEETITVYMNGGNWSDD